MSTVAVVALGGSLLHSRDTENRPWFGEICTVVERHISSGGKLAIVVGGGSLAREAIASAKQNGVEDLFELDTLGIDATRENAALMRDLFVQNEMKTSPSIPESIEVANTLLASHDVVVMGGTVPGHTTDHVAISLAAIAGATNCIIATNVSHVFTANPNEVIGATPFDNMTLAELQAIVGPPNHSAAGPKVVIDSIAVQTAIDNSISLSLILGSDSQRLASALAGEDFEGTRIEVN